MRQTSEKARNKKPDLSLLSDVFAKRVGTQAALLAGFTLTVLVEVDIEASSSGGLTKAFVICSVIVISSELLTAFTLGTLAFTAKIDPVDDGEGVYQGVMYFMLLVHLLGLSGFLTLLIILAWLKFAGVALPVTIIVVIAFITGIALFTLIVRKSNRLAERP